jgi:imidazole glycerol-phosphate synthase subunit HisF
MRRARVIPVILLQDRKLVKTRKFGAPRYVGDPLNALRIFNEKEVDELVILDISASLKQGPDFGYISNLVSECFMPIAYGGGIRTFDQAQRLFSIGVEKVVLGAAAFETPKIVTEISKLYGAQSAVVCIDVKKTFFHGDQIFIRNARSRAGSNPLSFAMKMESAGAGEIILQSIDRDGTGEGYDLNLIRQISEKVNIPVIALGGAGKFDDFKLAIQKGKASAVGAGSLFVFHGPHRAVLISYPEASVLQSLFNL